MEIFSEEVRKGVNYNSTYLIRLTNKHTILFNNRKAVRFIGIYDLLGESEFKEVRLYEPTPPPQPPKKVPIKVKPVAKTKKNNLKPGNDCNKRNPAPPCGPGMHERKRPNGSVCCYKGEPAAAPVKKQPVKTQKKVNNSKVDSQEKLYELDFAYKPVTLKDLDSQVDYKSLSKN